MNESVFRKKSLDHISSLDEIDDYMKVTSPSMWLVMGAIILLLVAAIIWSITGKIETTITTKGLAAQNQVTMELTNDQMDGVVVGSEVRSGGEKGEITEIIKNENGYLVIATLPGAEAGTVSVSIVTESIAPVTLLTK